MHCYHFEIMFGGFNRNLSFKIMMVDLLIKLENRYKSLFFVCWIKRKRKKKIEKEEIEFVFFSHIK
jgi:hypothetical protein